MAFLPQLGPSTLGSFAHARDFEIRDSQFYDFSGGFHHHHTGQTGNETALIYLPS